MAGKKKKTTTVVEEIPPDQTGLDELGETSTVDLDLQRADDIETVERILADNGISNVTYRFYDNDGGYCYSSPELDYDRARRETKGGKNCKLGVFIGNKIIRMVPFPLSPLDATGPVPISHANGNGEITFLKDLLLKLIEKGNTSAPAVPTPSLTDLTGALAHLDGLRVKPESEMATFIKGMEFAQASDGKTDWKTDLLRTAKEVIPHITGTINAMRGNNGSSTVPPIAENPAPVPPEAVVKAGIAYLKKKALSGVPADLIIDWVVSNHEEFQAFIGVALNTEFADLVQFDPELGTEPFASWFKSIFDGLRSELIPSNSVDEHPGRDSGDGGHLGSDGEPSPAGGAKPKG